MLMQENQVNKSEERKCKKICFAASSGGHLAQIMMLKPLMEEYPSFIVTEKAPGTKVADNGIYYLRQVNRREIKCLWYLILNTFQSLKILTAEKPDVIITTGVLGVVPLCILGKFMRKKLIFIESFAKVESSSMTGRLMYHFADHFFVQWENMKKVYPKAIYKGGLY